MICVYPGAIELLKSDFIVSLVTFCEDGLSKTDVDDVVKALCIRILVNLFYLDSARLFINSKRQAILDIVCNVIDSENAPIRSGVAALLLNFSIEFYSTNDVEAKVQILTMISEMMSTEKDIKNLTNMFIAICNIIHISKENINLAKDLDMLSYVEQANAENEIFNELKEYLKASLK